MKNACWLAAILGFALFQATVLADEISILNSGNTTSVSPLDISKPSDDPDVIAQCEKVCKTETQCGTLPIEYRGDCMQLCRSIQLDDAVRSCMAETDHCAEFSACASQQAISAPMVDVTAAQNCNKNKRQPCPGVPNGCGYPQVCCTQIYGGGGHSTRIHLCGKRDCPWYTLGQGPWCGCPSTKDVYGCN